MALRVAKFALAGLFCIALGLAVQAQTFPPLTGRVVDQAGVLDAAARSRLDSKLADLESKTSTELVVATLPSLQGYEIADYGYRLGRHWGIGQKGKNNGAILIVAPKERSVRIEVGYGLEGTLTDAVSRLIIENSILPRFRANDTSGGIERGVDDIVQVFSGDAEEFKKRAAARPRPTASEGLGSFLPMAVFFGIWLLMYLNARRQRRRGSRWGGWLFPGGGGWSSGGGWGGGGWSSGSGGGFGGGFSGGGGSFGGGGASGRW
jgi:uncharacterized protein